MLSAWNDYLGPLIFLQERSKYTLALGLASFKGVYSESICSDAVYHSDYDRTTDF